MRIFTQSRPEGWLPWTKEPIALAPLDEPGRGFTIQQNVNGTLICQELLFSFVGPDRNLTF